MAVKQKLPIHLRTQLTGGDFGTGDKYWDNTKLLLTFDDAKGSLNSVSDLSQTNNVATLTGSPPPSVDQSVSRFPAGPHGPTGSLSLTGGHVQYDSSSNWHPDAAFTIELDARITGSPSINRAIISRGNTTDGWQLVATSSKTLSLQTYNSGVVDVDITSTATVEGSPAVWKNVTVSRDSSGVWRTFIDGALQGQQTEGSPTFADVGKLYLARADILTGGDPYWTSVDFLSSFEGSPKTDESLSNRTMTLNSANTSYSTLQSKFGTTSVRNTGAQGGGLRIGSPDDATNNDFLIFAGDFTIEFWMYLTASTEFSFTGLVTRVNTSGRTNRTLSNIEIGATNDTSGSPNVGDRVTVNAFNTDGATGQTLPGTKIAGRNRWNHVALTRELNGSPQDQLRLFVNGLLSDSRTVAGSPQTMSTNSSWPIVGASSQSVNANTRHNMNGYIDELRVTDGVARYTSNFTPPTQEFSTTSTTTTGNLRGNIDNVRITKGTARYTEAFTPPRAPHPNYKKRGPSTSIYPTTPAPTPESPPSDPFFDSVVFLAPYTTNLNDVSGYNIPGVAVGSPTPVIVSTSTLFGENVLDLTGANSDDAITYFDTSGFNFGAEDFTFEFHANFTDKSVRQLLGGGQWGGAGQRSWFVAYDGTTNYLYYYNSTNGTTILGQYGNFTFDPTEGQWYHFAWVRDGNSFRCFVDGVELTPNASNPMGTLYNPTNDFYIGDVEDTATGVRAYMANVRLTRGIKRYTANFTPPTLHHPTRGSTYREAILADEPLVYFRMDDFDSGINGNPIGLAKDSAGFDIGSLSGSPAGARWAENTGDTVRFRNASILPCGEGRSVYHTGASWGGLFGQEHPAYTPSGSLTIEGWVCVKGTITNQCPIFTKEAVGTNLPEYKLTINSSRTVTFYLGSQNSSTNSSTTTTTTVLDLDTVYHVVGVFRTSDNVPRIFINGVEDKVGSPVWPYTVYDNTSGPNSLVINDGGNSYRGEVYMQEVAFYPTGLTDAQILNHYTLGSTAPTNDPYWYWTELLLPFDGTDAAASPPALIDQSDNVFTGNFVGSAELDTAQKKFGTASAFFGGSPRGYISFADDTSLSMDSESFTVEFHVRFNGDPGIGAQHTFVNKWNNGFTGGSQKEWWVGFRSNLLQVYVSTTGSNGLFALNVSWDPAGDTWYHIAFVFDREKSLHETRVYVDGVQVGASNTALNSYPTIFNGSSELWVGGYDDDVNDWMDGWIDNVRITKGVARYVATFTPPSAAFPTE